MSHIPNIHTPMSRELSWFFTGGQLAAVSTKRCDLQRARARVGDTPQLICSEISAWIEAAFGYKAVAGDRGGIRHWFNVAVLYGQPLILDAAADQFRDEPEGVAVYPASSPLYRWFDKAAWQKAGDVHGPAVVDAVFNPGGFFRPMEEHPLFVECRPSVYRVLRLDHTFMATHYSELYRLVRGDYDGDAWLFVVRGGVMYAGGADLPGLQTLSPEQTTAMLDALRDHGGFDDDVDYLEIALR